MDGSELKHKTFQSVIWAIVRIGASNVLSFGVFLVLARVLSSRDFGIFALAMLVVDVARVISTAGLADAVTRDKGADELLADTAFWANLGLGGIIGAAAWGLASAYAWFIGQPEIIPVLHCLAVLIPVSSLGSIHTARKLRAFGHKSVAARTIVCGAAGGAAAVAAALAGLGVWSLVVQAAIVDVLGVAFAWQSFPWRPRLRFDRHHLAAIWAFSGAMMLIQLAGLLLTRFQDLLIGRFVSVSAVGSYRIAWRMIDLIGQTTVQPIVTVSFVTLSHLQDDPERFRRAFLRMLGLGGFLTLPALIGFGVLSDDAVTVLFGAKWAASADIAKVLALMAVPFCMNFFVSSVFSALGRPGIIAKSTLLQLTATIVLSGLAAPLGVEWVAGAYVLRAYLTLPFHLALLRREAGLSITAVLRAVMPPFLAALAMVAALLAAMPFLHAALGHGIAFLAVAVPFGGAVYAAALMLFAGDYVRSNLGVLLPLWRRQRLDSVLQEP